jgi:hypothetical protein
MYGIVPSSYIKIHFCSINNGKIKMKFTEKAKKYLTNKIMYSRIDDRSCL